MTVTRPPPSDDGEDEERERSVAAIVWAAGAEPDVAAAVDVPVGGVRGAVRAAVHAARAGAAPVVVVLGGAAGDPARARRLEALRADLDRRPESRAVRLASVANVATVAGLEGNGDDPGAERRAVIVPGALITEGGAFAWLLARADESAAGAGPITTPLGAVARAADLRDVLASVDGAASVDDVAGGLRTRPLARPTAPVDAPFGAALGGAGDVARIEQELAQRLASRSDGLTDTILHRPIAHPLARLLARTPITPNQITVFAFGIGLASAGAFAVGSYALALLGAALLVVSAFIDCVDGELARLALRESRIGKWLDLCLDNVVHVCLFVAIGLGVAAGGSSLAGPTAARVLGASAAVGTCISFLIVVLLSTEKLAARNPAAGRLVDATANRDFTYALVVLAIAGRLDVFLWLSGIGSHVYWLGLLGLALLRSAPEVGEAPTAAPTPAPAPATAAPPADADAPPAPPGKTGIVSRLLLGVGLLFFGGLVYMAGPRQVASQLTALGPWVLLIPIPYGFVYLLDAYGFKLCLRPSVDRLGLPRTYVYRMAGEALNWTLPAAQMGGEPLKPFLLARAGVPTVEGGSAVVISKVAMTVAQMVYLAIALIAAALFTDADQRLIMGAGVALAGGLGLASLMIVGIRWGAFAGLARIVARLGVGRAAIEERLESLADLDERIRGFAREHPGRLLAGFAAHVVAWIIGAAEVALVLWLFGEVPSVGHALAIEAFVATARGATAFIPGSAGGQEGAIVLIYDGFGYGQELAVAYALLRRFREAVWISVALGCLAAVGGAPSRGAPPAAPRDEAPAPAA